MKQYNKLVRDRIPEIIQQSGKTCKIRALSDEEYGQYLREKLKEEVEEYLLSSSSEELADILEVIYALAEFQGLSREELERLRLDKAEARGSFQQRVFLELVE